MKKILYICLALCALASCSEKPRRVDQLRAEKNLQDSIDRVRRANTIAYCDSMMALLTPQVDEQLRRFRYEKNDRYEDHGHYVHPLLNTGLNAERCFLQPYVSDHLEISLRSYYYGSRSLRHECVRLMADSVELRAYGVCHHFEATAMDGTEKAYEHEIMTINESDIRGLLSFVDAYRDSRIQVVLEGKGKYRYVLSDKDKQALLDTYQLAVLMSDIHTLEAMRNQASR